MKPMLPTLHDEVPLGDEWRYEVKYDGFRTILIWDKEIKLISRNGKLLNKQFPEIVQFLTDYEEKIKSFLPLTLDGELVSLENDFKGNFLHIQIRGKISSEKKIHELSKKSPCHFLCFDILKIKGKDLQKNNYLERKKQLNELFEKADLPLRPDYRSKKLVQSVLPWKQFSPLWDNVVLFDGEGIVAKKITSQWMEGKRTTDWVKYKNWKLVQCFITAYDKVNGYFSIAVYEHQKIVPIGQFLFGMGKREKESLYHIIKENKTKEDDQFIYIDPSICVEIKYLEVLNGQLREPHFHQFLFDSSPLDCTLERFIEQQKNFPKDVEITHPAKPLWNDPLIKKIDYLHFLHEISPYLLPFLKNRLLTVIRYPHGINGEAFYQKNCPDYAPTFVDTFEEEGIRYVVCNNLKTLLWLGNQISFEFHIPFQTIDTKGPSEIVFDLDPPSPEYFHLAIKGALLIKEVLDQLELISFVKTSGKKGMQVYIPLPDHVYSFEETRLFTSFIAEYLVSKDPQSFTTERMKKNRGNRLYIDYVQHGKGKTVIAPYSPRGTIHGTIAAPLYWEEIDEKLKIEHFTIQNILERIKNIGDPFHHYFHVKNEQNLAPIIQFLKEKRS